MALVTWNEKLSVGVHSVDEQHTVLFNLINDLHAAMLKGQARAIVGGLLKDLLAYTRNHFTAEEELMDTKQYPELSDHKRLHRELTKQVEDYIARYEKGDLTVTTQLAEFLSNWLNEHIQKTDQAYGPWLNARGVH
jgi:hemerythrin-like metal-binding protein